MTSGCPVTQSESGDWLLTGYAEVLAATQDVDTFRANFRAPGIEVPPEEQFVNEIPEPRHGQVRRIINSAIAGHRLTGVEPLCDELCRNLLAELRERGGSVDLVREYVMPVPNSIIAHLLGAEPADYEKWAGWSDEVVQGTYPSLWRNERGVGFAGAHPEFAAYIDAIIADRRAAPREDFVTRLITREVEGRTLTDVEARAQLVFLFISGNETTRHLIGNLLHRLATDPSLFAQLAADRTLIEAAIEESLRLDPPVRLLMRTCSASTVVAGEPIDKGDAVIFGVEQANRDEDRFENAEVFDLERDDIRRHLAFGGGPHVCPGAHLARMEARVAIEALLDAATGLTVEPGYVFADVPVAWAHGPSTLPVRIDWAPQPALSKPALLTR
jgi:cytochrome P450